jgi:type IV pilus assembly protein PilB
VALSQGGFAIAIRRRAERGRSGLVLPGGTTTTSTAPQPTEEDDDVVDLGRPLIGSVLLDRGDIGPEPLEDALQRQADADPGERRRIGEMLVADGLVGITDLVAALAQQNGLEPIDLRQTSPDASVAARLPQSVAEELDALPIRATPTDVIVAVGDPSRPRLRPMLVAALGGPVILVVADPSDLARARAELARSTEGLGDIIRAFEARATPSATTGEAHDTVQVDENAPIVQVVSRIIEQAVERRASDVHIEPMEDRVRIRNRIDGALKEVMSLPPSMAQALSSRIKIMAGLNIVERRRPQDGQIETVAAGRTLDIRVSTAGTVFGESVVLRILDRAQALQGLGDLGMRPDVEARYREVIQSPYGLVVCAGPTGSGKTTTLYTTLQAVKSDEINVMTVEDPVEYVFPDINQMSINEVAGLTFASGLRAILRQDPDTILVGEIRDVETARIAIQAALTGHFVLSTVHATDAASALHRFIDMGMEGYLLSSALLATVGQRLVRRVCEECARPHHPSPDELAFYERAGGDPAHVDGFRQGAGCEVCSGTGYFGRVGVYEVLRMTDELRGSLIDNVHADAIRKIAVGDGMVPMQDQAIALVAEGQTTIPEVMRTVYVM